MNYLKDEMKGIWESGEQIAINNLPLYSPWISRLLGLSEWTRVERTAEDVEREYDREKYGRDLDILRQHEDITSPAELFTRANEQLEYHICAINGEFRKLSPLQANVLKLGRLTDCLKKFLPAKTIIDLGAGLGDLILHLAEEPDFAGLDFYALEKMGNARSIISELARRRGLAPRVGHCNVFSNPISDQKLPEGAVIIISSVVSLRIKATVEVVAAIKALRPKVVVHFEPFPSFFDLNTLYGQLCYSYALKNKYNMIFDRDLFSLDKKEIQIVGTSPLIFGNNPFFPLSMIAWTPLETNGQ